MVYLQKSEVSVFYLEWSIVEKFNKIAKLQRLKSRKTQIDAYKSVRII